jgi:formylglycine-generating enzyme required for sulfatase activity
MGMVGECRFLVGCTVAVAACGRIGFDPRGGVGDANRDGTRVDGAPMVSCVGLAPMCGSAGASSCCNSRLVAGGTFYRSFDVGTDNAYPDMTYPAMLSDVRLDTYEVTVGRFRQFLDAGMGTQTRPPLSGAGARVLNGMANQGGWDPTWNASLAASTAAFAAALACNATHQTWTDAASTNEALPIGCVTWYEAFAFCVWDGGFLPTEAEWNYTAAGGNEQRAYPWSQPASSLTIDCSFANYYINTPPGTYCVNGMTGALNRVGSESPKGDGRYGQADLAGNAWEWTLDAYQIPYAVPCDDCADLGAASAGDPRRPVQPQCALPAHGHPPRQPAGESVRQHRRAVREYAVASAARRHDRRRRRYCAQYEMVVQAP